MNTQKRIFTHEMKDYYDSHIERRAMYQARIAKLIEECHLIVEA